MAFKVYSSNLAVYGITASLRSLLISTYGYHDLVAVPDLVITDYVEQMLANVIEQLKHRHDAGYTNVTHLKAIIEAIGEQCQDTEDGIIDMISGFTIAEADGVQLDEVGNFIGELRGTGQSDADYRTDIALRIRLNGDGGTPDLLIEVVETWSGATMVRFHNFFPGSFNIFTNGLDIYDYKGQGKSYIIGQLQRSAPAGVKATITHVPLTSYPFSFDYDGTTPTDALGFTEEGYGDNQGMIAELLSYPLS